MEIKYNATGVDKKTLVKVISEITGITAKYQRTPTFSYAIGDWYTVTRDGNLDICDRADSEEVESLLEQLEKRGFTAEHSPDEVEMELIGVDEYESEEVGFSIGIPISEITDKPCTENIIENLNAIVASKKSLFQKAIGTTSELPIFWEEDTLWFDWFDSFVDQDHLEIYTAFIKALYKMAESAKRVTAKEKPIDNEKFAMRTFLNRIGLSGAEHKTLRKELMKNLSGNSAFRYGNTENA
jgi:hypothetical protein